MWQILQQEILQQGISHGRGSCISGAGRTGSSSVLSSSASMQDRMHARAGS